MYSYIHIPFCESKCSYCRFASISSLNRTIINTYISRLILDIGNFNLLNEKLDSIYFWWWTPSILDEKELFLILEKLKNKFSFKKNIEITIETTAKNITLEKLKLWKKLEINRISIWIQTLNNQTLEVIWRDKKKIILAWLDLLKDFITYTASPPHQWEWFSYNISIDFIIWLPFVKLWETLEDIKYILNNYDFIKHISVYMLEDYYEVKDEETWFNKITYPETWKNNSIKEEDYLVEYLEIKNYLETMGFYRYELSNFAKIGYECIHNKSYWNHSQNIWFWLWSHSFVNNTRYAYKDDFLGYYAWKLEYSEFLQENDIFLEKIMFQLRTSWIEKEIYEKLNTLKIDEFIKIWFLEMKNNNLIITDKTISLIDKIILELI